MQAAPGQASRPARTPAPTPSSTRRRHSRVADNTLESLFSRLGRFPDVEARQPAGLGRHGQAPAGHRLSARGRPPAPRQPARGRGGPVRCADPRRPDPGRRPAHAGTVRVHQDLITGERALRHNAGALGIDGGFEQLPLGAALLAGRHRGALQLPRSLAELEEIADAVARHAAPERRAAGRRPGQTHEPGHERRPGALLRARSSPSSPGRNHGSCWPAAPGRSRRPAVPGHRSQRRTGLLAGAK